MELIGIEPTRLAALGGRFRRASQAGGARRPLSPRGGRQFDPARPRLVHQQGSTFPSAGVVPELLVKMADALDISTDELLGRKAKRKNLPAPESLRRWRRFKRLEELPPHDQKAVLRMIDALAGRGSARVANFVCLEWPAG